MTTQSDSSPEVVRIAGIARAEGIFDRPASSLMAHGHVVVEVAPHPSDGLTCNWAVDDKVIPREFSASILRGIEEAFAADGTTRPVYAFTHTQVSIVGGSYFEARSRELAYTMAAIDAFRRAVAMVGVIPHA